MYGRGPMNWLDFALSSGSLLVAIFVFFILWKKDQSVMHERQLEAIDELNKSISRLSDIIEKQNRMQTEEHNHIMELMRRQFEKMDKDHAELLKEQLKFHTEIRSKTK